MVTTDKLKRAHDLIAKGLSVRRRLPGKSSARPHSMKPCAEPSYLEMRNHAC